MLRTRPEWLFACVFAFSCSSAPPDWGVRDLDDLALPTTPGGTNATPSTTSSPATIADGPAVSMGLDGDRDGDGLADGIDRCPDEPETKNGEADEDGCPDRDSALLGGADTDGDSIGDAADLCPSDPEDKDGFQDSDGCPDPDNDRDGVLDALDACPNDPARTANGCPNSVKR